MTLCSYVLHFVARVGALLSGDDSERDEDLSRDSLLSERGAG